MTSSVVHANVRTLFPFADTEQIKLVVEAMDHVSDIVELTDKDLRIVYVNQAFERLTGYDRSEVLGKTSAELLGSHRHVPEFFQEIETTVRAGKEWSGTIFTKTKTDDIIKLESIVSPLTDSDGDVSYFIAIKRNVSEREDLREKLMQAKKLAAVGQLAAGVSHEINNPLAYMMANVNFVREELHALVGRLNTDYDDAELVSALSDIEHGATRIRDIVKDLSSFSKFEDDTCESLDVIPVLENTLKVLENEIKHRAQLTCNFSRVHPVWASRGRLGQVFLHLTLNAVHAIPVGQKSKNEITISTFSRDNGDNVIQFKDTGEGIPSSMLSKVFDPFFSTRPVGKGTGLGLSICHNVITGMGGNIEISSVIGQGTTVEISLPTMAAIEEQLLANVSDTPRCTVSRVLVVDDEEGVLRAIERMLPTHDITTTKCGRDALALLQETEFAVVLCDLMMPEITGMELYEKACELGPSIGERFIFVTGGAFTSEAQEFLDRSQNLTIQKPFNVTQLRQVIASRMPVPSE